VLPVGGGEDVGLRAVLDLGAQLLAAGEVEADDEPRRALLEREAELLERLAQRRRRRRR
jgi:hypothetical protein